MNKKVKSILLCGPTGVGKSTIVRTLIKLLQIHHINCSGFYSDDIRLYNGVRIGFDVVNLSGDRAILARQIPIDDIERQKIGKYQIFVKEFEELALPSLTVLPKTLLIIDEIGKMQLLSEKFREHICGIVGKTSLVATIPKTGIDFVEDLKSMENTLTLRITKSNRLNIVDVIFERICQMVYHTK